MICAVHVHIALPLTNKLHHMNVQSHKVIINANYKVNILLMKGSTQRKMFKLNSSFENIVVILEITFFPRYASDMGLLEYDRLRI